MKFRNIFAAVLAVAVAVFMSVHADVSLAAMTPDHVLASVGSLMLVGDTEIVKKAVSDMEAGLRKISEDVKGYTAKASEEIKQIGAVTAETSGKLGEVMAQGKKMGEDLAEAKQRLTALEQAGARRPGSDEVPKSAGEIVTSSAEFKAAKAGGDRARSMDAVVVGNFHKTAIVNATGQNQPLVPADRVPGIVMPGLRRFTVRDLLPSIPTSSNLIEFAKENVFTNNAGPQYSSPNHENVTKNESGITFTLDTEAVRTLAHWIPASRQVLSDAGMLAGYINSRLIYGLKLKEEDELLNGDGTGGDLNGLVTQATAFNHAVSGSSDTNIDTLLRAMNQVALSEFAPTGIILHPTTWTNMQLIKDANGNYIFGDPQSSTAPTMWGLPVIATQAMTAGHFMVGAFALAAAIHDREDASVRVAEQHSDYFVKNMVAILAEERLALVVYRPAAIVEGTFDA